MADKLYLVKATVETKDKNDKKGRKVVLLRSDQPQPVPAWLVKELKAEGIIDAADEGLTAGKAAGSNTQQASDTASDTAGGADGDDNSGD